MRNVILIHGWGGSPQRDWFPWANKELTENGFNVRLPEMPDTENPRIIPWKDKLTEVVSKLEGEIIIVGHSIGCQTALRFIEKQKENFKIEKLILVAPWWFLNLSSDEEKEIARPWLESYIDFEKIKSKTGKIICVFSDNDPVVPLEKNVNFFKEKLSPEIIIKNKMGHFSGDEGVTELPFLIDFILN